MRSAWLAALVVASVSCTEQPKTEISSRTEGRHGPAAGRAGNAGGGAVVPLPGDAAAADRGGRGADESDGERWHRACARVAAGRGGGGGAAGVHRAAHGVREPGGAGTRGAVPRDAAGRCHGEPLRDEDRRALAGGGGGRAAGGPARLRGLPAPQAGPGPARAGARQRVQRAGLPHPGARPQGDHPFLLAGAGVGRGAAAHPAARPAQARRAEPACVRRRRAGGREGAARGRPGRGLHGAGGPPRPRCGAAQRDAGGGAGGPAGRGRAGRDRFAAGARRYERVARARVRGPGAHCRGAGARPQ